jgi:hypothetical protein
MILPPVTVTLSPDYRIESVSSVDEAVSVDITGAMYANILSIEAILNATQLDRGDEKIKIAVVKDSRSVDAVRQMNQDPSVGVLLMFVQRDQIVLVVDTDRELIVFTT